MMTFEAAQRPIDHPHALIFVLAAFVCLGVTLLPLIIDRSAQFGRRCWWGGTAGVVACVFIAALPDVAGGLMFGAAAVFASIVTAYFATSYLKINGKVYTFHTFNEVPEPAAPTSTELDRAESSGAEYDPYPDQYGTGVTAAKMWWLLLAAIALCVFTAATNVGSQGSQGYLVTSLVVIAVFAFGFGLMDASWGYQIARRQFLQFALVGVVSAGAFTALYLGGYLIGRRWPMRSRKSLEYRVHPRFRDEETRGGD